MSSMETLAAFLGWCTAINMGMLIFASVLLGLTRGSISKIHAKMFALDETESFHWPAILSRSAAVLPRPP